ncbi:MULTISPECIES: tyrosine-type recombinase/integrase [unclassified Chryseobacterium]|uniref:tyrosine-type recombinase/integrase n=1 Tax=unclassified Chryseobacterium TaxID=2593645 RepID=UPI000956460C|nr:MULTISPECIES: tyrosine-type recombinase/integrase [unclassified Chryseobacterium]SIR56008.1 Site-specific recombinase XerD [Chryseobacterium sp. RU33C]
MIFTFSLLQEKTDRSLKKISLSITQKNEVLHFKTPLSIEESDWDYEKQRPKNIYCKKYKELNYILNSIKVRISQLIKEGSKKKINTEIKKITSYKSQSYSEGSLLSMISLYIVEKQHTIQLTTYRRYMVFMRLIEKFEGFLARRIYIHEINSELIRSFNNFAKAELYCESTISRTCQFLKTILHFAERKGLKTEIRNIDLPKVKTPKKIIILNEQEILKIKNTIVPPELEDSKNWLLISCYTGQRVSDFMRFNEKQLIEINGKTCISFTQRKTHKEIILPLHQTVLNVIKKYGNSFPKPIEIGIYNDNIKKIAALAGIESKVEVKKRIGYRSEDIQTEKWKIISSHIGRRSFASNFYGRIPTSLLIQATGHSSERMFLNYVNPLNHERITTLGNYFDKMYIERS